MEVPEAMSVQLSRLLGDCKDSRSSIKNDREWKRILKRVLFELDRYLSENVQTDEVHRLMLYSSLLASDLSLKENNFWPGYTEGITRLALLLMGDYPDHRKKSRGRKKERHYALNRMRSLFYLQTSDQKLQTLIAASKLGEPQLSRRAYDVLAEFRQECGFKASYREFWRWYRKRYPNDYASVF